MTCCSPSGAYSTRTTTHTSVSSATAPTATISSGTRTSWGIAQHCFFLGYQDDVARFYAAIDVLLLPSANEGTPVSVIEALAARRPVVATRVGGVPDVVREARTASSRTSATPTPSPRASSSLRATPSAAPRWANEVARVSSSAMPSTGSSTTSTGSTARCSNAPSLAGLPGTHSRPACACPSRWRALTASPP